VLLGFAVLEATGDVSWWIFVVVLLLGGAVLAVYSRRAAAVLGIRSREETPRAWLNALALPSGVVGVLAFHAGRHAGGFVILGYLLFAEVAERVVWSRFRATQVARQGEATGV
jgi:hypothetical protein